MASVSWDGFDHLRQAVLNLGDPPMEPLVEKWVDILVEGNRRNVLRGIDGYDQPMTPLKYRMGKTIKAKTRGPSYFGTTKHAPKFGIGGNLTAREYRELTGPRLAPRREQSRIIANLHGHHGRDPGEHYAWFAEAVWLDVVSKKDRQFLMGHFEPQAGSRLPRYDLRPVRPADMQLASDELRVYAEELLGRYFA